MAFKQDNGGGDIRTFFPMPSADDRGVMLYSDGTTAYWSYPGNPTSTVGSGFRYRTLFTHGFLAGGYKGYNPWRSVNKTWHATDITYYCGEQLDRAAVYLEGVFSDYNAYVLGTVNSWSGNSVHTSSYNLHNGIGRQRGDGSFGAAATYGYTGNNPAADGLTYGTAIAEGTTNPGVGGWNMSVARDNHGATTNQIGQAGYAVGGDQTGNSATDKLHFATEIMYTTTANGNTGFTSGCNGETRGYCAVATNRKYITYATDVWTAWTTTASPDGWCKIHSTKYGHHYAGNGGNVTLGTVKFSDSTGSDISTFNKLRSYGEENYQTGQDWGYMLGNYDSQQNNMTVKYTYSNDAQTLLGAAAQPKGHYGQSSGALSSAAATIVNARV